MLQHPRTALASHSTRFLVLAGLAAMLGACGADDDSLEAIPPPEVVTASRPPPPISGGTLLVTANNQMAVASDPDRDRVLLVDLTSKSVVADIALNQFDEPGRVVEGAPGTVFVALRRGGEIVAIDLVSRNIARRMKVCPAPRGLAYDNGQLHVACASGELVTMSAATGAISRTLMLGPDLRDVVVEGTELLVTRFRTAEVVTIDASGAIVDSRNINAPENFFFRDPRVAWRMVKAPSGNVALVHQMASKDPVNTDPGGYGQGPCGEGGIVTSNVTFRSGTSVNSWFSLGPSMPRTALPVDIAFSADGTKMAVVGAGSHRVYTSDVATYQGKKDDPCGPKDDDDDDDDITQGEPIAVAYAGQARIVQTREPARIVFEDDSVIELGGESMRDTGHQLFHQTPNSALGLACASCHPEGQEDSHVWFFAQFGQRRTQNVAGGILATAPLHWDGLLSGFDTLMSDVFTSRMGGGEVPPAAALAAAVWVDSIPLVPVTATGDAASVERGKVLYNDPQVGCANCHSGSHLTNNQTVNVGTNGQFQVPMLRSIAARAPFMHDGCAPTLRDRFTNPYCGGGDSHGVTSKLTSEQIDDLVHYLETL